LSKTDHTGEEEVEETLETMIVPLPVAKSELTLKVACELMCLITIEEDATCGSSLLIRPNNQTHSQGLCTRQISLNSG